MEDQEKAQYIEKICDLEDQIRDLEIKVDLLTADRDERDAHIRVLKGQLQRKQLEVTYPVGDICAADEAATG